MKITFIVNVDWFFISHRKSLYSRIKKHYQTNIITGYSGHVNDIKMDYFNVKDRIPTIKGFFQLREYISKQKNTSFVVVTPVMIFIFNFLFPSKKLAFYNFSGLGQLRKLPNHLQKFLIFIFQIYPVNGKRVIILQNNDDFNLFDSVIRFKKKYFLELIPGSGFSKNYNFKTISRHSEFRVGYVGRIRKDKGVLTLIRAFNKLKVISKLNNLKLEIWGELDLPSRHGFSENELLELRMNKSYFKGFSSKKEEIYNSFDFFCLPSDGEGLSKSAIESAAFKKILILSNVPGNKDMIQWNNGYLFEYNNEDDLTQVLNKASLLNQKERKIMANKCFNLFNEKWDSSIIEKSWIDLFKKYEFK